MLKLIIFVTFLKGFCGADPILDLFDPICVVVRDMKCPNENITFWLYTQQTQSTPVKLDPLNLKSSDFRHQKRLYILLHGYGGDRDDSPNQYIRPALLEAEDVYVISVDYSAIVPYPCYFVAVRNVPLVAKCLGQLFNNLVEQKLVDNDDIHVIGFSLGAHVTGQTANYVHRRLKRITGLDPARPMYITVGSEYRLDRTDAEFVDVIHTDVWGKGMLKSLGHADFYPNLGPYQPGCWENNDPSSCNHNRAPQYYAESISSKQGFWASRCPSRLHNGTYLCKSNDALMGFHVNQSLFGSYYLKTGSKFPFAKGLIAKSSKFQDRNLPVLYDYPDIGDDAFEPQLKKALFDWSENNLTEFHRTSWEERSNHEIMGTTVGPY